MLWYYVADRTTVFPQGIKVRSLGSFTDIVTPSLKHCNSKSCPRPILLCILLVAVDNQFKIVLQSYSRDVLAFLFLVLTLVAMATSRVQHKAPLLLNRKQTEEWKGWMQVICSTQHRLLNFICSIPVLISSLPAPKALAK